MKKKIGAMENKKPPEKGARITKTSLHYENKILICVERVTRFFVKILLIV
jgi:hypothetical protein